MNQCRKTAAIEAILFAAGDSVSLEELGRAVEMTPLELANALDALQLRYAAEESGLQLKYLEDRVQLATKGIYGELLQQTLTPVKTRSLSQSMLEALTIIAYRQPVTRGEVDAIRGVRSEYAVSVLEQLGLIVEVGRKDALGRPILYGTTEEFLRRFGLESLQQLPELADFAAVAARAEEAEQEGPWKRPCDCRNTWRNAASLPGGSPRSLLPRAV